MTTIPRYLELAEALAAAIATNQFAPGARLPGELELAAIHKVSRTTIRQALAVLELEGHIRRERGRRTIVSQRLIRHLDPLLSFDYDMATQGIAWQREIVDRRLASPPAEIRARLQLRAGERVLFVREKRTIGSRPCSLNERYIQRDFRDAYQDEVARGVVFYTIVAERTGAQTYAAMELHVGPAPAPQARLLAVKRGALVLLVRFVHYLNRTRPIELVDAYYPIDRWRFVFQRLALIDPTRQIGSSVDGTDSFVEPRVAPPARA
jgi:GntR family transcriptional regulator